FGGFDGAGHVLGGTWTWDGSNWTQQAPATSPPARDNAALVADPGTGQVVLFGGRDTSGFRSIGDTWTWDGSNWTQRTPTTSPPARQAATIAADRVSGRVLLF